MKYTDDIKYTFSSNLLSLWEDSGKADPQRVMIFGTRENMVVLIESTEWFVDGTFDVSPNVFKQLLTINVVYNGLNLPLVYA